MEKTQEIVERALTVPEQAQQIVIVDNESYTKAGEILLVIKDIRKQINEAFDPIISKAFAAHKEAVAQKKRAEDPLVKAEGIIKPRLAKYAQEQERKRFEEQRRQEEELRKQEEERKLQEAIAAEKAGNKGIAEEILAEPIYVPPVILPKETPKVAGISFTTRWKFKITDETKIPREYLMVDEVKIGGVVRSMKEITNIPGIQVYSEQDTTAGRR